MCLTKRLKQVTSLESKTKFLYLQKCGKAMRPTEVTALENELNTPQKNPKLKALIYYDALMHKPRYNLNIRSANVGLP
jgi:hypothetical protein